MEKLKAATGLEPKGGMFRDEESVGKYIVRALEKAKDEGILEALKQK